MHYVSVKHCSIFSGHTEIPWENIAEIANKHVQVMYCSCKSWNSLTAPQRKLLYLGPYALLRGMSQAFTARLKMWHPSLRQGSFRTRPSELDCTKISKERGISKSHLLYMCSSIWLRCSQASAFILPTYVSVVKKFSAGAKTDTMASCHVCGLILVRVDQCVIPDGVDR